MGKRKPAEAVQTIRDRVVELRRVKASDLIDNPLNWRTHPEEQRAAISGVLNEIGFAGAQLAYETPEGLVLIDGHARKGVAGDAIIPVLVTDLTEDEAKLVLASFDPIGAMAQADATALGSLLEQVQTSDSGLADLLASLQKQHAPEPAKPPPEDPGPGEPPKVPVTKPGDLWLLGAYFECEDCKKTYTYEEGLTMKECPCG